MASIRALVLFVVISSALCFVTCNGKHVAVPKVKMADQREIPVIGLGTWLGYDTSGQGRIKPVNDEVYNAVLWAFDAGYRHIDTALIYSTEEQVGRAVRDSNIAREEIFLTTKLWNDAHDQEAVVPALRKSLQNFGLDYVDLYLIHWPIGQYMNGTIYMVDYLDTWKGMMEAKKLGLAKSIGVSNFNQSMIQRIIDNGLEVPAALQVEINLNLQQPDLVSYCKSKGIAVEAYTPFGSMFYSKARPDAPPPRIDDPQLVEIANRHNKTVPQIALRYLVDHGVIPLPKSISKNRIEENVDIFDFSLSPEEKETLKSFDKEYRTLPQCKWFDHPYYPFVKKHVC